jgi:predicted transcriptional regulator
MSGVFKSQVPLSLLYALLRCICPLPVTLNAKNSKHDESSAVSVSVSVSNNEYIMIDIGAFKRGIFLDAIHPFMESMATDYYRPKYAFYAQRPMTGPASYAHFIQVIRHICKAAKIEMITSLKYEQSLSNKVYYVYYVGDDDDIMITTKTG